MIMATRAYGEVIVPFEPSRELVAPATAYRSTWLLSSLQALRDRGHIERYYEALQPEYQEAIRSMVAGVWVPLDLARAHYRACDALGLGVTEQIALGRAVSDKAQGTMLGHVVRMAKAAGVTPWTVLPQYHRLYQRGVQGSGVAVFKIGPKEARIEIVACELFDIPYFRTAFRGVLQGIAGLFCRTSFIHDVPTTEPGTATYRFQWA
jgi:hypothetical protein